MTISHGIALCKPFLKVLQCFRADPVDRVRVVRNIEVDRLTHEQRVVDIPVSCREPERDRDVSVRQELPRDHLCNGFKQPAADHTEVGLVVCRQHRELAEDDPCRTVKGTAVIQDRQIPVDLPDVIIPYSTYSPFFVLRILAEYFAGLYACDQLCEKFDISDNQLRKWISLWKSHKRQWLGLLDDVLGIFDFTLVVDAGSA